MFRGSQSFRCELTFPAVPLSTLVSDTALCHHQVLDEMSPEAHMLKVLCPAGGALGSWWTQEEVGPGKEVGHGAISWKAYLFLDRPSLPPSLSASSSLPRAPSRYPDSSLAKAVESENSGLGPLAAVNPNALFLFPADLS